MTEKVGDPNDVTFTGLTYTDPTTPDPSTKPYVRAYNAAGQCVSSGFVISGDTWGSGLTNVHKIWIRIDSGTTEGAQGLFQISPPGAAGDYSLTGVDFAEDDDGNTTITPNWM